MFGTTGHKCPRSGFWKTTCCGYRIALSKGETFPPCGRYHGSVTWTLDQAT